MPTINLQKLALESLSFSEYLVKANAAIQNPQKYFKQQQANANITQIASECLTFGQFIERINSQRQRGETHVQ
jgi:hypothetical protein